jgi:hypothetical protein
MGQVHFVVSPNDMESIISSANQYARDVERIDADNSVDSTDTSGLTRKERKESSSIQLVSNLLGIKDFPPLSPVIIEWVS